jgi:acetolactate synthase-1/2/3 large subunit
MPRTQTMSGAEATVKMLEAHGIKTIFGMCGHTVVAVLNALSRSPIRFISVHHEGVASHAVDGMARRSGHAEVVLLHLGPALTNAITGIANASLDGVPMVVLSGNIQSYYFGRNAHQETNLHQDGNQADALAPWVKRIWKVTRPEALLPSIEAAFRVAETGRKGPVLVDVAMDVFSDFIEYPLDYVPAALPMPPSLSRETARDIIAKVRAAKSPVLYFGYGAATPAGAKAGAALAEKLGIPVAYELLGKGVLPDDHPLNTGVTGLWGSPAANAVCREADLVLAVGAKFAELDTCSWTPGEVFSIPGTRLVHICESVDEIGRNYRPELGIVADPVQALQTLLAEAGDAPAGKAALPAHISKIMADFEARLEPDRTAPGVPMHPARVVAEVGKALPANAVLFGDTGWNKNGVGQQLHTSSPSTFIAPGTFATMGFGPTGALGAAMDGSGDPVIALTGDGAFLASISAVLTAVEEKIPVVWVVMNNSGYGSIAGLQRVGFGTDYGTLFDTSVMDFVKLAEALGARGARIEKAEDLGRILKEAIAAKVPYLIEVPTRNEPAPITGSWDVIELYKRANARRAELLGEQPAAAKAGKS